MITTLPSWAWWAAVGCSWGVWRGLLIVQGVIRIGAPLPLKLLSEIASKTSIDVAAARDSRACGPCATRPPTPPSTSRSLPRSPCTHPSGGGNQAAEGWSKSKLKRDDPVSRGRARARIKSPNRPPPPRAAPSGTMGTVKHVQTTAVPRGGGAYLSDAEEYAGRARTSRTFESRRHSASEICMSLVSGILRYDVVEARMSDSVYRCQSTCSDESDPKLGPGEA